MRHFTRTLHLFVKLSASECAYQMVQTNIKPLQTNLDEFRYDTILSSYFIVLVLLNPILNFPHSSARLFSIARSTNEDVSFGVLTVIACISTIQVFFEVLFPPLDHLMFVRRVAAILDPATSQLVARNNCGMC